MDLAKHLLRYQRESVIHFVTFTKIQEEIQKRCRERWRTLLYRRFMQRIATTLAEKNKIHALVTGESLGQVASQTLENIAAVEKVTPVLILRPLIAFNKLETIDLAKKIGTYDISIRPYEDCCTLFQPKEPATRSRIKDLVYEEEKLSITPLIEEALSGIETVRL